MSDETEIIEGEIVDEAPLPVATGSALAVRESTAMVAQDEITVGDLLAQSEKIAEAMRQAMQEGTHYGRIPGVDRPTLLKPGAEKLLVLFRLAPHYVRESIWGPGDHLTVMVTCELRHAPTGIVVATGEGMCSTRESRYAYRKGERTCPECGEPQVREGKPRNGRPGNWYCWQKMGGCGATWPLDGEQAEKFRAMETGRIDNPDIPDQWNCVTPDTRVLTRDLRWVRAGCLESGDVLIGVQEESKQYGRPYEDAIVTVGERFHDDLYEILVDDGRTVRCNGEHRWLVKGANGGTEWVSTETIYNGMAGVGVGGRARRSWRILSTGVWDHEDSAEAGYLAGLLDADGSLDVGNRETGSGYLTVGVSFAQQEGGVLDRMRTGLAERDFTIGEYAHSAPLARKPVVKMAVRGGLGEQMRLLGTVRPPRLIDRWMDLVDLRRRRFEGGTAKIESVTRVGRGELVRLGTTSHTYIAEGLVCHNTVLKMADKRALIAAILNGTAASDVFTQDMEDSPRAAAPAAGAEREFDPGRDLLPGAIKGKDAPKRLSDALNAVDSTVKWGDVFEQASPGWRDLKGEAAATFWKRLSNTVEHLSRNADPAAFPPASDEVIVAAFAWGFEGAVVSLVRDTGHGKLVEHTPDDDAGVTPDDIPFGDGA